MELFTSVKLQSAPQAEKTKASENVKEEVKQEQANVVNNEQEAVIAKNFDSYTYEENRGTSGETGYSLDDIQGGAQQSAAALNMIEDNEEEEAEEEDELNALRTYSDYELESLLRENKITRAEYDDEMAKRGNVSVDSD